MTTRFFAEDTVALKDAPSILATVQGTWRDIDSGIFIRPGDFISHDGVTPGLLRECFREGHVPNGYAAIEFIDPYEGSTIIKETELLLKDRGHVVGDVVKRLPSDSASGSVIKTSILCTIEPIYTNLPYHGSDPWLHKAEENRIRVPAEELEYTDIEVHDYVLYRGFFGEVFRKLEEVTMRLENGSVVRVRDVSELEVPCCWKYLKQGNGRRKLVSHLKRSMARLEEDGNSPPLQFHEGFYPGQIVHTKKANLRLGSWIIGSYSPSVPPRGVIVESRVISIEVVWMRSKITEDDTTEPIMPDDILGHDELQEVKIFNRYSTPLNTSTSYGSRYTIDAGVGDKLRFRDVNSAAAKYSDQNPQNTCGVFRRIPRMITQGFDMNVFTVQDTKTLVTVQWQDGSITNQDAASLIPYMNVDENDVWVGEIVSLKSAEVKDGVVTLKEVGVVQAVDARERLARVRWYEAPQVGIFEDDTATLVPGSAFGKLSNRESSVSLYEVAAYPPLSRRRGDIVLIQPQDGEKSEDLGQPRIDHSNNAELPSIPGTYHEDSPLMPDNGFQGLHTSSTVSIESTSDDRNGTSPDDYRWLGEVVDLGLDGFLTVRLGATARPEDIKISMDRVQLIVGGDDEDYSSEGMDDGESSNVTMELEEHSASPVEQEVIYEGGTPSDIAEDAWMTSDEEDHGASNEANDDQGDEDHEMHDAQEDSNDRYHTNDELPRREEPHNTPTKNNLMNSNNSLGSPSEGSSKLESHNEYNFSQFPNMPQQFEIVDESTPSDHHFLSEAGGILSAKLLRRIKKEHDMLRDSLPTGIWVRTWAERINLFRVLIVGPRGTPYELAPFVFDFYFPENFPLEPPEAHFHSWTSGARINPNLYADGKVCLSVLGTWPEGDEDEGWNPDKSSLLQVIVSLLGLVLVEKPFYNEAGYESLIGTEDTIVPSRIYSEKALCMAKGFVDHGLTHDLAALESVIKWLYVEPEGPLLLKKVVADSRALLSRRDDSTGEEAEGSHQQERLSKGAEFLLKKHLIPLESILAKLETT